MKIQVFSLQHQPNSSGLSRPNLLSIIVLGLVILGFLFNFNQLEDVPSTNSEARFETMARLEQPELNPSQEGLVIDSSETQQHNEHTDYAAFSFLGTRLDTRELANRKSQARPTPKIKPQEWPPVMGKLFPDFTLWDTRGKAVKLSSLKGTVILVQYVAMNSSAAQAYSGANRLGSYYSVQPQKNLRSIFEYVPMYGGGISLANPRIQFVQILLSNMSGDRATIEDAQKWSRHFQLERYPNQHVFVAAREMFVPASAELIPGFQLIDARFRLKADATGSNPRHNLYRELIPQLSKLAR